MFETLEAIREIAEAEGVPMARLAIAWAMARPGITCMLVGTRNINELTENLHVVEYTPSAGVIENLDTVTAAPLLENNGSESRLFHGCAYSLVSDKDIHCPLQMFRQEKDLHNGRTVRH